MGHRPRCSVPQPVFAVTKLNCVHVRYKNSVRTTYEYLVNCMPCAATRLESQPPLVQYRSAATCSILVAGIRRAREFTALPLLLLYCCNDNDATHNQRGEKYNTNIRVRYSYSSIRPYVRNLMITKTINNTIRIRGRRYHAYVPSYYMYNTSETSMFQIIQRTRHNTQHT